MIEYDSLMPANTITFTNNVNDISNWVMRITPDRKIEVNPDVSVDEAAKTVLDAVQRYLTPQTKPLSDEEIDAVVNELRQKANDPERWVTMLSVAVETILDLRDRLNTKPLSDEEIEMLAYQHNLLDDYPHKFVRAIEERHGIK